MQEVPDDVEERCMRKILLTATALTAIATASCTAGPPPPEGASQAPVHYDSCADAEAAGVAPIHIGQPGYSTSLDRDGDGIACE
jgi:hypothetical protein